MFLPETPQSHKAKRPRLRPQYTLWWSGKARSALRPLPSSRGRPPPWASPDAVLCGETPRGRSGCSQMRGCESHSQTLAIWQDADCSVPRFPHLWEHQAHAGIAKTRTRSAGEGRGLPRQSGWALQPGIPTHGLVCVAGTQWVGVSGRSDSPLPGGCDLTTPGSLPSAPRAAQPAKGSTVHWLQTVGRGREQACALEQGSWPTDAGRWSLRPPHRGPCPHDAPQGPHHREGGALWTEAWRLAEGPHAVRSSQS